MASTQPRHPHPSMGRCHCRTWAARDLISLFVMWSALVCFIVVASRHKSRLLPGMRRLNKEDDKEESKAKGERGWLAVASLLSLLDPPKEGIFRHSEVPPAVLQPLLMLVFLGFLVFVVLLRTSYGCVFLPRSDMLGTQRRAERETCLRTVHQAR